MAADDGGNAGDDLVVQWYVIDPDLGNFYSATVGDWQPEIVAAGRLDGGQAGGHHYHPAIGVTQQGVAYIEYTYSDGQTWPQVRRVTLNSSYNGIVPNSTVTVQTGPALEYNGTNWAHFNDMQVDPSDGCAFWSVHTLVADPLDTTATSIDKRDLWLFETQFNCNNSNLNFVGGTDVYDMPLFNSYYTTGARRVDMNTDGTTDAADAAIYADEYDKATGP